MEIWTLLTKVILYYNDTYFTVANYCSTIIREVKVMRTIICANSGESKFKRPIEWKHWSPQLSAQYLSVFCTKTYGNGYRKMIRMNLSTGNMKHTSLGTDWSHWCEDTVRSYSYDGLNSGGTALSFHNNTGHRRIVLTDDRVKILLQHLK